MGVLSWVSISNNIGFPDYCSSFTITLQSTAVLLVHSKRDGNSPSVLANPQEGWKHVKTLFYHVSKCLQKDNFVAVYVLNKTLGQYLLDFKHDLNLGNK